MAPELFKDRSRRKSNSKLLTSVQLIPASGKLLKSHPYESKVPTVHLFLLDWPDAKALACCHLEQFSHALMTPERIHLTFRNMRQNFTQFSSNSQGTNAIRNS